MTNSEVVELIAEKTANEIKNSCKQIIIRNLKLPWQYDDNDFNKVDAKELKRMYEILHNNTI
jgi:hypothetical protein